MKLRKYDYDKGEYVETGEVSLHAVAKSMDPEQFAELLETYTNNMSSGYKRGLETGRKLTRAHRTIQRSIVTELVGVIAGMTDQEYTDPRNEQAIALAKAIKALYEEQGAGPFV